MSENCLASSSFGDPNAQPLTPKQTPESAALPSPVLETPNPYQYSFAEAGDLAPCFAEEYSVFNATPGNLRGNQGLFPDFAALTGTATSRARHKRLLSIESVATSVSTRAEHLSSDPTAPLSPVDSAQHQLPFSQHPSPQKGSPSSICRTRVSSDVAKTPTSTKGARRGTLREAEPSQVISPPPTAQKRERRKLLAPNPSMQNDKALGHADFANDSSQHDMTAFMANVGAMFGHPMSVTADSQPTFWDPSISMGMDMNNFAPPGNNLFQPPATSHRHTGSFDWNADVQLFQDPAFPPSSNQENLQPLGLSRTMWAPKSSVSNPLYTDFEGHSLSATHYASNTTAMDDPFIATSASDAVDPGLLLSRPQSAVLDTDFGGLAQSGSAEMAIARSGKAQSSDMRRSESLRGARNSLAKATDRATASSPVKASGRSGLCRSVREDRRNKPTRRVSLPLLAPATTRSSSGQALPANNTTGRLAGRVSPFKGQPRLTSLASIPEISPRLRSRTSVRLFIDAHGRARTETTIGGGSVPMARSRSSQDLVPGRGYSSSAAGEDSDDTDDEPIIIPSRTSSFKSSFALPDPRKPVGSIFHSSNRSIRERSSSSSANEAESEAETVLDERPGRVGDATSELRKLVKDRQNRSLRLATLRCQRLLNTTNLRNFPGGIISPTSLTESSYGPDGYGVRCVCSNPKDDGRSFMVQCESCEMWLHGQCINITRRTMPSVYICGFCANTPNTVRRRTRDSERDNALGIRTTSSMANKPLRSFR